MASCWHCFPFGISMFLYTYPCPCPTLFSSCQNVNIVVTKSNVWARPIHYNQLSFVPIKIIIINKVLFTLKTKQKHMFVMTTWGQKHENFSLVACRATPLCLVQCAFGRREIGASKVYRIPRQKSKFKPHSVLVQMSFSSLFTCLVCCSYIFQFQIFTTSSLEQ